MKAATSGKGSRRDVDVGGWAEQVRVLSEQVDVACASELRPAAARPTSAILRLRARDDEGTKIGGTAVLTLYKTGSWTWGGDADAISYAREPLERHGVMPC